MTGPMIEQLSSWLPPGGEVFYYPNPGNAGDALIASATWQVFDELGLQPTVVDYKKIPPRATVLLGGGGNLVPYYKNIERALELCIERDVERCLLLPHTIRGHETLLARLDDRFTLVCRDEPSLAHVREYAPEARAFLADDMALGLNIDALERRAHTLRHKIALMLDPSWLKYGRAWRSALGRCRPDANGTLTLFRCDREAASKEQRDPELDLMSFYKTKNLHRAGCDQVTMDIIALLRGSRRVLTDRLHISLPAVLLGMEVAVLDNNYGKLSAVWNASNKTRQYRHRI